MKKLITNANIFDGKNRALLENANIIIENNMISQITKSDIDHTDFQEIIDAKGKTVLPGLIDSHVHLMFIDNPDKMDSMTREELVIRSSVYAEEILMRGFTTVRDVGSNSIALKLCIDEGLVKGPRIFTSQAAISQTCGHSDYRQNRTQKRTILGEEGGMMKSGAFAIADGVPEVLRVVREQLFLGASQIKIMASGGSSSLFDPLDTIQYTLEEQKAIVQAAEDYGTYVCAHIHTSPAMLRAAEAGVKCFEHASLMSDEVARVVKEKGIWLCIQYSLAKSILNREFSYETDEADILYKKDERVAKGILGSVDMIKKHGLIDRLIFGTDLVAPQKFRDNQLNEFKELEENYDSFTALKAATGNPHEMFKLTTYQNPYPRGKIGVLEEGSFADLLIIHGNPLENISVITDIENMKLIMKDGKIYKNTL